ncbi:uncharacterized protein N7496_007317 [Penicillium cataractarum]|uniref:Uncharacterized protein n=1 Tax=Penicillium cataractarum TaxID=2100454 RepID=A0A9W9S3I9_9EURO|nr:uncharacterized protein N7496_007317 [Penicillium cataractarum]KAJ5371225.1 hypothetical protein N7496_007317 [Penicillium cataractarum]
MVRRELICRVEDPRPLFKELDQLHGHDQEDLSRRELLQRLQGAASHFKAAPKDNVCVATRWNGLMVQNALARSVCDDAEAINQDAELSDSMREGLPYTQKTLDKLAQAIAEENERAKERAEQSKQNGFAANSRPGELGTGPSDQLEHRYFDSRLLSYEEVRKSRTRANDSFKQDVFHRLDKLELEILQHKKKALEEELRLRALENTKTEKTWEQRVKDGDKGQAGQLVKSATEETIPQTHEQGEIYDDGWANFFKEPQTPHKQYRYASFQEIQDESRAAEKRGRSPANPGTTESQVIFEEPDELCHNDGVVGESVRPSRELGATVYVEEKPSSEDERRARPRSSTRSSRRDSQDSEHR